MRPATSSRGARAGTDANGLRYVRSPRDVPPLALVRLALDKVLTDSLCETSVGLC